jgi:hypothetical protein
LLKKKEFREEHKFKADAVLSFEDSDVSIGRSKLFNAIRKILSDASEVGVTDTDGREWKLKNESEEKELPTLMIFHNEQHLNLSDFGVLSPDKTIRLRSMDEAFSELNLPVNARNEWHNTLSERALDDNEVDAFHNDLSDTPVYISQSILNEFTKGKSRVFSLAPPSRRYFERLVGCYDGSTSILDYAAGSGRKLFDQLSAWQPYDGFLYSLFLSSHSALTAEISVEHLGSEELIRAFTFLEESGDRISQLGAVEVGLRVLPERPEIEPIIIRLIEQIRDDEKSESISGFKLLSALFLLVDEELSRARLFSIEPPFYRRLASLSQAALIHRQLLKSSIKTDPFYNWVFDHGGEQYYLQTFADMRLEPRWHPDFASAPQMKEDFFGRIMIAASLYEKNFSDGKLRDLVLGTDPRSLQSLGEFPRPYFPGPLEGAVNNQNNLSTDFLETIKAQLGAKEVGPSSFIALVNSALIFRVDSEQAELAARALKLGSYRLEKVEDKSQLLIILNGLASVAATARSTVLADELRILVRRYRQDAQYSLSIEEAMKICLVAAASRTDLNDWREFAGDWLTELAFGNLENDEGEQLRSHLHCLFNAVPELWINCGRADAALMAHNASKIPTRKNN